MTFSEETDLQQQVEDLRQALARSQRAELKAKRKNADLVEAMYGAVKDSIIASNPVRLVAPPKDKRKARGEVCLIHLTDWQAGKKTVSYGLSSLRGRIELMTQKVMQLTDMQRAHHPVRECVLMLGGDMVEGIGIFPGQSFEIEADLFQQLFEVVGIIESTVLSLCQYFDKVHVVCEYGNHGRIGRKGDMPNSDNIDRIAYRIAGDKLCGVHNLTWQESDNWYQMVEIGNYRAMLVHGDEINSYGGNVPAFGILRKCNAWATGVVEEFNDVYMGHFHTPMTLTMANSGRVFVTGSPESHNEYARVFVAAVGKPSQRLHYVDGDKGRVTAEYTIWLD